MNDITDDADCHPQTSTIVHNSFAVNPEAAAPVDQSAGTTTSGGFCMVPWAVVDARLSPHELAVYIAIVRHANESGQAWPSMDTIARVACMGTRKAREAVGELVKLGLISREFRKTASGDNDSTLYHVPRGTAYSAVPTAYSAPGVRHMVPGGTAYGAYKVEPINQNHLEEEPEKREKPPAPLLAYLVKSWNTRGNKPTVTESPIPKSVVKSWQAMTRDPEGQKLVESEAAIDTLLDAIAKNGWATAQPSWGIDWLLTRNSSRAWKAERLLAGAYAGRAQAPNTASSRLGPGVVYDPTAKERNPNHGTI